MEKNTAMTQTVGIDLGDRRSHYAVIDEAAQLLDEGAVATSPRGLARRFESEPPMRVVVEAGTHSGWVARALETYGHEVLVGESASGGLDLWRG